MTTKTLGQVCKEAWFAYEPDFMSERWEAAAEAVVKAAGKETFEYALHLARSPRGDAERAVIEAAVAAIVELRAYCDRHRELFRHGDPYNEHRFETLLDAVEAYEKEKG